MLPRSAMAGGWLATLLPVAVLFHLAGNGHHLERLDRVGGMQLVLIVVAVAALLRPGPVITAGLAALHLLIFALKLPFVGNHELILALVEMVVLGAVAADAIAARGADRPSDGWVARATPALRAVLLVTYGAIAVSKLNRAFLDHEVSCAVVFSDELGRWIGVQPSGHRSLSLIAIVATAVIEAAVPVLLFLRRTRAIGIGLGLSFHFFLALDPASHVFDFSSVLLPLFLAFLPADDRRALDAAIDRIRAGTTEERLALLLAVAVAVHGVTVVTDGPRWAVAAPLWLLVAGASLAWTLPRLRPAMWTGGGRAAPPPLRPAMTADGARGALPRPRPTMTADGGGDGEGVRPPRWALPVVAIAVLVAIGPYAQYRTSASLNMYSNLRVVGASSNHLFLPALPGPDRPRVRILDVRQRQAGSPHAAAVATASDAAERGVLVPEENLRRHLHHHPGMVVRVVAAGADEPRTVGPEVGWGWRDELAFRLLHRRVASATEPAPCARAWGPLG